MRFIELMPLGTGECSQVAADCYVSTAQTRRLIEEALRTLSEAPTSASEESRNYCLPGAKGIVGFISPVSEPYCETCNRMRLTADGKLHLCLLHHDELEIQSLIRSNRGGRRAGKRPPSSRDPQAERASARGGHSVERRQMLQIGG